MKYAIYILAFAIGSVLITNAAFAQGGVSINSTSTAADPSAMLDVASTSKGVLVPRMDSAQRVSIINPATGLLVYQTDGLLPDFYYYNGTAWAHILSAVAQERVFIPGMLSFTTPGDVVFSTVFKVTVVGAGGGGSSGQGLGAFSATSGAGGGAGAATICYVAGLAPNTTYTLQVGTGGASGVADGSDDPSGGLNGQASTVTFGGVTITSNGGNGGITPIGGNGGSVSVSGSATVILNNTGGNGTGGSQSTNILGGNGGASIYGNGGSGSSVDAVNLGSGGAGGSVSGNNIFTISSNGGAGANGSIIIDWGQY